MSNGHISTPISPARAEVMAREATEHFRKRVTTLLTVLTVQMFIVIALLGLAGGRS